MALTGRVWGAGKLLLVGGALILTYVLFTAAAMRVNEGGSIALALLNGGRERAGETLIASSPTRGQAVNVRVVEPHFYDPEGTRYRD